MKHLIFLSLFALCCVNVVQAEDASFLSTGVGEEERVTHNDYALKLVFFEKGGSYVAYVDVAIYDQQGIPVLETQSEGPWLFANLQPGLYSVRAVRQNGSMQSARFEVTRGEQTQLALMFPKS